MTATILRRGDRRDQNFKLRHYRNRNYLDTCIGIGLSYACYFFLRKPTACPKGKAPFRKPPTEANDMTESKANEATGAADYATGYGKPPLHTRFPKGQSGNPAGRPPNAARLRVKALTLEEAYRAVVVREDGDGRTEPVPALQAVLRSQIALAIKGNGAAQRAVLAAVQAIEEEEAERRIDDQVAAIIAGRQAREAS
jgi:hypothetical protein